MNETMSLLLATTLLSACGLGLYMYKQDESQHGSENYNEDTLFSSGSFWGSDKEVIEEPIEEELDDSEYKPRSRQNKTKKNTKKGGGTKRRY